MNQEDCDLILEKGVEAKIYPHGNPDMECEGIARLIECVEDKETKERWLVQFTGENRLLKRLLRKPDMVEAPPDPPKESKMIKRIVNGQIRYFYRPNKTILGLERTSHSETKHEYKKMRKKKSNGLNKNRWAWKQKTRREWKQ